MTKPIAFHFNGKNLRKYSEEIKSLRIKEGQSFSNAASVFTFDNELKNKLFVDCCDKIGVPYINLGEKEHLAFIEEEYPLELRPRKYLVYKDWKKTYKVKEY